MHPVRRSDTIPGNGIDQELELEYWRAVRDSADLRELEGFLARFPAGIYADLARRRLQRLSTDPDTDATVLQGRGRPPAPPVPLEEDPDATRTEPMAVAPRKAAAVATGAAGVHIPTKRVVHDDEDEDDLPPVRQRRPRWALAGVAVVGVLAVVSFWGVLRHDAPPALVSGARAPLAAPKMAERQPQVAPATSAPTISSSQEGGLPSAPGHPVASRSTDAKAAKLASSATAGATKGASRRVPGSSGQTVAQAPGTAQRDAAQEQGINGLVPPSVTCKDKVFLAKQFCVYNECQKPGFDAFPSCVRQREEAKLREGSRYGN